MIKKIFISILVLTFLLCILEVYCYFLTKKENEEFKLIAEKINKSASSYKTEYEFLKPFDTNIYSDSVIVGNTKKSPIIWFGCSFAEGSSLNKNETPCFKISQLTRRSCINRAKGTTGTQFMYYQLMQNEFKDANPNADYIIYTFIWDHLQRLHNYQVNPLISMHNLRYKIKDGYLQEINPTFNPIYSSFLVKRILNKKIRIDGDKERENFRLFNRIMKETVKIAKIKYPNAQFIMLEFPQISDLELPDYEIKKLEMYGITVLKAKDFLPPNTDVKDKKYWLEDELHPTAEFWDLFLPKLVEAHIN